MKSVLIVLVFLAGASLGVSGCASAPPPCVCPCAEAAAAPAEPRAGEREEEEWAAEQEEDAPGEVDRYAVPVTSAQPSRGPADALVTMVVFSDFQCPFCARMLPIIDQLLSAYPTQLRVVWRNLPLGFHPNAMPAAEAAMEAYTQGGDRAFWQMHDLLFENQRDLSRQNIDRWAGQVGLDMGRFTAAMDRHTHQRAIEEDAALAARIGAQGTPNSFINGIQVTGAQPYDAFTRVVDMELRVAERLVRLGTPAGRVYAEVTRDGLTVGRQAPLPSADPYRPRPNPDAVYRVPLDGALPQRGPSDALVTIVVFSDFQCPFCARVEPTITRLLDTYGQDVRLVWMNNPLGFHPNAMPAAIAALEAYEQGGDTMFWALHGKLFENQNDLSRPTIERLALEAGLRMRELAAALDQGEHEADIQRQQQLAQSLGATGTPSFFINGRNLRGAQPYEAFEALVDEELAKARALVGRGTPRTRVYEETTRNGAISPQMLDPLPGSPDIALPREPTRVDLPIPRNAPSLGPARAPVVIQEISDFQCPFCARVQPTIARLLQEYEGRVRLVWRDLPLPFHPNASPAAQAAREVFRQRGSAKFWAYNALLFENQRDLTRETLERLAQQVGGINMAQFRQALDSERHRAAVEADSAAVQAVGINGTPGFVINGMVVSGAQPYEHFQAVVERALAEPNQPAAR